MGTRRKASSTSHFDSRQCLPNCFINLITVSILSYCTAEFSGGICELIEFPFGKDRSVISLNFPGIFFGMRPSGEQNKSWSGGFKKEPAILFFRDSLANLVYTSCLFSKADL